MLKLRLLSSRHALWSAESSLFHVERACLQMRKVCENVSFMTLIATEFETGPLSRRVRDEWHAAKLLKSLELQGVQRFPRGARLSRVTKEGEEPAFFSMKIDDLDLDDIARTAYPFAELTLSG